MGPPFIIISRALDLKNGLAPHPKCGGFEEKFSNNSYPQSPYVWGDKTYAMHKVSMVC